MFLVLSISFVAAQTPAAPDDVLAKAHGGAAQRAAGADALPERDIT
jgi:hypothetical protein